MMQVEEVQKVRDDIAEVPEGEKGKGAACFKRALLKERFFHVSMHMYNNLINRCCFILLHKVYTVIGCLTI